MSAIRTMSGDEFSKRLQQANKPAATKPLSAEDAAIKAGRALRGLEGHVDAEGASIADEIAYAQAQALTSIAITLIRMERK